jgi:hypothetical protein
MLSARSLQGIDIVVSDLGRGSWRGGTRNGGNQKGGDGGGEN